MLELSEFQLEQLEQQEILTAEEFYSLGYDEPCELIEGKIVYMHPTGFCHGFIEGRIYALLNQYLQNHEIGKTAVGEVDIYTQRNPDSIRAADVIYISHERLAQVKVKTGYLDVAPELVVEVLSPTDRWTTVTTKLDEYFSVGVDMVWVVDTAKKRIHVYRSPEQAQIIENDGEIKEVPFLPDFVLSVAEVMSE